MRLEWSELAYQDRMDTFQFIARDSVKAAARVDDAFDTQAEQLVDFPESGRIGRWPGTRELVISGLPYILVYRVIDDLVFILRVLHGARQWPDDTLP